jgi:NAD(P)-dependent dehydrogenase (short-subunit alcohol dehydrogenase family)
MRCLNSPLVPNGDPQPERESGAHPRGHFGSTDDITSVVVMLAMTDYMTGQTISVNGGWYMS